MAQYPEGLVGRQRHLGESQDVCFRRPLETKEERPEDGRKRESHAGLVAQRTARMEE